MSVSDPIGRRGQQQDADEPAHPLADLSQRLADARRLGDPAPDELERLVGMLARGDDRNPEDDRLSRALDSLSRWSEQSRSQQQSRTEQHDRAEPKRPAEEPRHAASSEVERSLGDYARAVREAPSVQRRDGERPTDSLQSPIVSLRAALAEISARQQALDREPVPSPAARAWSAAPAEQRPTVDRYAAPPAYAADPAPRRAPDPAPADRPPSEPARSVEPRREPAPASYSTAPKVDPAVLAEMRAEIAKLGRAVGELPSRNHIDSLAGAMTELSGRLGEDRPASLDVDSLRAIEALVGEVERMRGDAPSPTTIRELGEELKAIAARLDVLGPRNTTAIDMLARRIDDVRGELQQFPHVGAVDRLAAEIQSIVSRLDRQERSAEPARQAVEGLSGQVAALDGKLDQMVQANRSGVDHFERLRESFRAEFDSLSRAADVSGLGRQIDALTEDLKTRTAPVPAVTAFKDLSGRFDALGGKIDAIAATAANPDRPDALAAIERQIQALSVAIAARQPEPAPRIVHDLAHKVDSLSGRIEEIAKGARARGVSFDRVEEAVRQIAEHITAARPAATPADASVQIEAQVARLVDEIGRNGGRLDDLGAAFAGLASRIEQSCARLGSEAARAAVEEASLALGQGRSGAVDVRGEVAQALADLRNATSISERRTADTLDAVRLTLDRLLDRIEDQGAVPEPLRAPFSEAPRAVPAPSCAKAASAPAPEIDATEAARAAARRAMEEIAGQAGRPAAARPSPERASSRGPDDAGVPQTADARRDGTGPAAQTAASFIAAARRNAAQQGSADEQPPVAAPAPKTEHGPSRLAQAFAVLKARKRPLIVGIAATLIVFAALYVASGMTGAEPEPAPVEQALPPERSGSIEREPAGAARDAVASQSPAASAWPAARPATEAPPPAVEVAAEPEPAPAPRAQGAVAKEDAPAAPKGAVPLSAPRAKAADLTDFAFGDGGNRAASPARPDWKTTEPLVTGSFAKSSDGLPAQIGAGALRTRALQGDAGAELEVADRLIDGRGVEPDPALGARWLAKAAAQGLAPAQHRLGSLYEKGNGVARDIAAARRWYEQAAASGNVRAMHNLGVIHAEGSLGKPDFNAASVWFRMAAERGLVDSQYNLAILCARGFNGKRDLAEAYKWFALAAGQGDADASKKRDDVAKALGPDLTAAKTALASFRPRAVDPSANDAPAPSGGWDQAMAAPTR